MFKKIGNWIKDIFFEKEEEVVVSKKRKPVVVMGKPTSKNPWDAPPVNVEPKEAEVKPSLTWAEWKKQNQDLGNYFNTAARNPQVRMV